MSSRALTPSAVAFLLAAIALTFLASEASAQRGGDAPDIQLTFEKASTLSGAKQIATGAEHLQKMKDHLRRVFRLLEQARTEKDIVKLNSISELLSSMKGLMKVAEAAHVALQEAVARKDRETGDHEYTKIAIAAQKVEALAVEAEGVVGGGIIESGDTKMTVTAEGMAAEGDVPTGGAGADVPAGAGAGATGAASGIAGGGSTQGTPGESGEEGEAGTIDEPAAGDGGGASEFGEVPVEVVTQPTASPIQ